MSEKWSLHGDILDVFGLKGCQLDGRFYLGYHEDRLVEAAFTPVSSMMSYMIWYISKNVGADKVAYIGISPHNALQLYFERVLTREVLEAAEDRDDYIQIRLPIGGEERTLAIFENPSKSTTYYDLNWEDLDP